MTYLKLNLSKLIYKTIQNKCAKKINDICHLSIMQNLFAHRARPSCFSHSLPLPNLDKEEIFYAFLADGGSNIHSWMVKRQSRLIEIIYFELSFRDDRVCVMRILGID